MRTLWLKDWQDRLRPLIHVMKCYNAASAQQMMNLMNRVVWEVYGTHLTLRTPTVRNPEIYAFSTLQSVFLFSLNRTLTRVSLAITLKISLKDQNQQPMHNTNTFVFGSKHKSSFAVNNVLTFGEFSYKKVS